MASSSETQKSKGPLVNPAICRCCRSIKKCRLLGAEYEWMGTKEVYSDMIMDCFGLLLSYLDGDDKESCICATCVTRLREAVSFRSLVLGSEELFLQTKLGHSDDPEPKVEVELIKSEPPDFTEDGSTDDHLRDDDYLPDHHSDNEDTKEHIERKKPTLRSSKLRLKTEPKQKSTTKSVATKSEGRKKKRVPLSKESVSLKKRLLTEMKKLKHKLSQQTEKTAPTKKPKRPPPDDRESLAHQNALAMIASSYAVPFQNRVSNYYCFYCKDQFTDPTELREHTWKHPPKELAYYMDSRKPPKVDITRVDCRLCTESISDLEALKTHIASAHGEFIHKGITNECLTFRLTLNNLACTSCAATFPYFDQLKKHMVEHFGTFTCHQCGACFLEETSLLTHIRTVHHRYNEGVLFPCEICGKSLKSKYSKDLHIATVHEKKPTVNCYKCEASFLSHALRNRHLIEAHADKRTFPCKLCDKVYNRRKTLMEHNRRNHLKVFRHQCELCEQKFYIPSRLREHMVTHTGERNFRCELCDKTYPRLKSLREHTRTHTNERKYKCDVCQTTFTQNASLRSHVKSHHQGFALEAGFA